MFEGGVGHSTHSDISGSAQAGETFHKLKAGCATEAHIAHFT